MNRVAQLSRLLVLGLVFAAVAGATPILTLQGSFFSGPNEVNLATFSYDPFTDGSLLNIQTYGYGGTSNAPGGVNLAGNVIVAGGFDPIITLYSGTGDSAIRIAFNDDGSCPPGATDGGICFDSTLNLAGLSAGSYTLALTAFSNFSNGATLGAGFSGTGNFDGRTSNFAVDVQGIPEPATSLLLASGLLVLGYFGRRKRA